MNIQLETNEATTTRRNRELEEKLKSYARELRAHQSDAEQRIWHLLRDRHFLGFKFRRQHPLGNYILDFYCAEAKLAIELDGGQHADNEKYDLQRTEILQRDGIQVLRFWNNEVLVNTEAVLTRIAEVLLQNKSAPHPNPLPAEQGEGDRNTDKTDVDQSAPDTTA